MEVMVLALTNNHYIISQVDEVATEDIGQPDCKLTKPYYEKWGWQVGSLGVASRTPAECRYGLAGGAVVLSMPKPRPGM